MDFSFIMITVAALAATGLVAAVILYFVSQKFKVFEDPRIGEVEAVLPGANCGGCGFPGCHGMACALVKADDLSSLSCPVGGQDVMQKVASILGKEAVAAAPKVAVVRCNGTCEARPKTVEYDGAKSCAILAANFGGETNCSFGCLGCGDCVSACQFGAIKMNQETGLPEVDEEKCVGLPEVNHRASEQRSEEPPSFRLVRKQRQGSGRHEGLQKRVHRLWQVRERVPV